jgi:RNA polymerase sigma-70 factor (ECF subfamily)
VIPSGAGESERDAFEALTRAHLPRLYAFALRLTGEHAAAEDLVQDTYLKAYQAFHRFLPGRDARPWLMKILVNTYRDQLRRELHAGTPLQPEDLEALARPNRPGHRPQGRMGSPEAWLVERSFSDEVYAALADLPPEFRTVVLLADLEGLAYREIAALLGCPLGTVMSRLARGRKLLRDMLRDYAREHGIIEE